MPRASSAFSTVVRNSAPSSGSTQSNSISRCMAASGRRSSGCSRRTIRLIGSGPMKRASNMPGIAPRRQARQDEIQSAVEKRLAEHVAGRHLDIDVDARQVHARLPDRGQHMLDRRAGDRADIDRAGIAVENFAQLAFGLVDLAQHAARPVGEGAARRCEHDAVARPLIELCAGHALGFGGEARRGRLGNRQRLGRGADLSGLCDHGEQPEMRHLQSAPQQRRRRSRGAVLLLSSRHMQPDRHIPYWLYHNSQFKFDMHIAFRDPSGGAGEKTDKETFAGRWQITRRATSLCGRAIGRKM